MSALYTMMEERLRIGHTLGGIELHRDTRVPADASEFRDAAVLAAITEREQPGFLLIHRPSNMRAHPGQIAFPGGKLDPGETPIEAALREADEELGIRSERVRVIGTTDRYLTGSGFDITPVLAIVPPDMELIPNPNEVAQWFEAPLEFVFDPANHKEESAEWNGAMHHYWSITWQEHRIWGVTAALIINLSRRLRWHD
jgi:8-oxo-dGTP pyrophosphatase MutT (NUDIX family)